MQNEINSVISVISVIRLCYRVRRVHNIQFRQFSHKWSTLARTHCSKLEKCGFLVKIYIKFIGFHQHISFSSNYKEITFGWRCNASFFSSSNLL